jgi:elongation factor Tu
VGFWSRLFGRNELDTTVTDYQARGTSSGSFRLVVEDVFFITGRGTVVTGKIEAGSISVGDALSIQTGTGTLASTVGGLEVFRKTLTTAHVGENVGVILEGIARDGVQRGAVLTAR